MGRITSHSLFRPFESRHSEREGQWEEKLPIHVGVVQYSSTNTGMDDGWGGRQGAFAACNTTTNHCGLVGPPPPE